MANWWDDLRPQEAQSAPSGNWWDDLEPVNRKPFGYREESPGDWDGPVMVPADTRRSFSEFMADQKKALGSGVAMGASGLARLPVDAWNAGVQYSPLRMILPEKAGAALQDALHVEQPQFVKSLSENLEAAGERERQGMSSGQQAQAERFEHVDGAWDTAKFLATNPAYLATQGTEVAGQMAPGGMGTKGLSAFSRLMRGAKVETGVNAALQSGMAGSLNQQDVQQTLEAMPVSELRKHEDFERLKTMLETDDDEVVKDWLIRNNGSSAFAQSFAVNLATSLLTPHGTTIESAMLGNAGKAGSSRLRNAALGAAGEAVSEGIAESGEQVSQNINTYSPWSEGVGKAGVLGSVLGAGMGGMAGAAQKPAPKKGDGKGDGTGGSGGGDITDSLRATWPEMSADDILAVAQDRLTALEEMAVAQPESMGEMENAEVALLRANIGNIDALADAYGVRIAKPAPQPLRDGDDLLSGGNSLDAQGEAIRQQQSKDESALDASLDAMFAPEPADTDAMQPAELPVMEGRTWERDLAGITQDADAARAQEQKERELDAIWRESQLPVSLDRAEEADAIRAATGQDMEAPTAMQLAMQKAREKKAQRESQDNQAEGWRKALGEVPEVSDDLRQSMGERFERAERVRPVFDADVNEIAASVGGKAIVAPLKDVDRALSKVKGDYEGDASQIKDLVRGTIEMPSHEDAGAVLSALRAKYGEPVKLKSSLDPNQPPLMANGYRDINSVWMIDGEPVELQINVPEMLEAKKEAHSLYVEQSELRRKIGNRPATPEEAAADARLDDAQAEVYQAAWDAAMRRINSSRGIKSASSRKNMPGSILPSGNLRAVALSSHASDPSGSTPNIALGENSGSGGVALSMPRSLPESRTDGEWVSFPPESGTLGVPRSEMPQIKQPDRDEFIEFLGSRGITGTPDSVPAGSLKPTQAEFSTVKAARFAETGPIGGSRDVLVSSDGHVLDGHHQWMAHQSLGTNVPVIRLNAPIGTLLDAARQFPKVKRSEGAESAEGGITMQNRNRARVASVTQMQGIRKNPDPARLGFSRDPNTGAPMVSEGLEVPEGDKGRADSVVMASGRVVGVRYAVVEADQLAASHDANGNINSGYDAAPLKALNNGRVAGLQAAWAAGNADGYKQGILKDSDLHLVPAEAIASKRNPVLVRLYDPKENTGDMGAESNAPAQLDTSATEKAQTDARALPDLGALQWNSDGSIGIHSNAAFFRAWMGRMSSTEAAGLMDAKGRPNADALRRLQAAIVQLAYNDERLLTALTEEVDGDSLRVMNALVRVAPAFADLNSDLGRQMRDALVSAYDLVRDAIKRGMTVPAIVAQGDLLGRDAGVEALALFMDASKRSSVRMAHAFNGIASYIASEEASAATESLFGARPDPTIERAFEAANEALREAGYEAGLHAQERDGSTAELGDRSSEPEGSERAEAPNAFSLESEQAPEAKPVTPDAQPGLFAPPTQREILEAEIAKRDAERNGKTGSGSTDMLSGDGELFAGPRPEQLDIVEAAKDASLVYDLDGNPYPTERSAKAAFKGNRLKGVPHEVVPVEGGFALRPAIETGSHLAEDVASYGDTSPLQTSGERVGIASPRGPSARRRSAAVVPGQLELFVATNEQGSAPAVKVDEIKLAQSTRLVETGQFRSGIDRVKTLHDAAHILAPLRKSAQERFMVLALDENGKPLAVMQHTVGGLSSSEVFRGTVFGAASGIPGVKSVVFAHNHPSGNPTPSPSDLKLDEALLDLFRGSGVDVRGSIILRPNSREFTIYGEDGKTARSAQAAPQGERIPIKRRTESVPMVERQIVKSLPMQGREAITSPDRATLAVQKARGEHKAGVILLNNSHNVIGILPFDPAETETLRTGNKDTSHAKYAAAAVKANAAAAFIYGDATQRDGIGNLARALDGSDIRILDGFLFAPDGSTTSLAMQGVKIGEGPFFLKGLGNEATNNGIPSGLKAERSRDTDDLADRINRDLRRHGEPEGFKALSVPQDQLPDALYRALGVFERITGTRVVIFRNQTPGVVHFNGVNFRDGRVFVAEDSQFPLTLTAAHEWLHNIRRTNPELYEELVKEVRRQGRLPEYKQQLKNDGEPRWQSDDVVEEELTAAAVSDALTDPVFLQRLAERRRGSFRRIAKAFLDFLNTLTKGWSDQGSNRYLKDVEAFRDKLAEVLEAFEKRNDELPGSADVRALFQRVFDGGTNAGVATNEPVAGTQGDRAAGDESRRDAGHRAQHRPAGPEFGSRLDDLTPAFSDDIYWSNAGELHGHGIPADRKAIATIRTARGNPDAVVTIYRAVPKDAGDAIQAGDWVTLTREYAKDHGDGPLDGDYKIISAKVPAGSLFNEGNSIHEFGYHPNDSTALDSPSAPDDSGRNFDQPSRYTFNESDYRPQVVSWAKDRFGDDIAPNGKPAWQNFVRWFGDSKVVDAEGRPLVVYHGTAGERAVFEPYWKQLERDALPHELQGNGSIARMYRLAKDEPDLHFFAAERGTAESYGPDVVEAYLKIENMVGNPGMDRDEAIQLMLDEDADGAVFQDTTSSGGYGGHAYVVRSSVQIKSATGNTGDFDADNADIRYSRIAARVSQGVKQASPQKLGAMLNAKLHANILANTGKTGQFIADQIDDGFVRDWVDEFIDLTRAEEATAEKLGIKPEELPEHLQARRRENLRHGAYQDALQQAEKDHFEPVAKILGDADLSREGLADYLWWRHAGERDAYLRQKDGTNAGPADLAGIDPAEAARNIAALPSKERAAYEKAAAHIDALRKRTLDVLVDSGQIREEVRDSLLSRWQHYVPLRGMPAHMDDPIIASFQGVGNGLSVKRNPLGKKALGRKSKPSDILEEMHMDLQRALIGAEKQKTLKRIIGLIQANPDLGAIDPVKTEKREVNGVITHVQTNGDPQTQLTYLHKGQPVRIELADPELTRAVLDMNEPLPDALRKLGKATRWLSSVKTALSPYFMLINPIRDAGFAALGLSAEHGGAMLKDAATFYPQTFNAMRRDANGSPLNKDIDRYAREFAMGGGKTGYTFVNDIDGVRKDLNRMFSRERKGLSPLKVWNKVNDLVEAANGYAENSTRLAVFAAARKNGMTVEQAAKYAKEITVNFNTKGRLGKKANVAYMFFNAAVQGTRRFNTLMKNRSFQKMMAGMVGTSYALALAQMIAMGDDDDDESLYLKKIKDTDRLRSLPISVGDEEWLSIPVPYGPNFVNYLGSKMAEVTYETMRGRKVKPGKVAGQIFSAASQSFSPIDVDDGWAALSPEVLRVGYNFVNNKDDWGRPLNYTAHYDNEGKKPLFKEGNAETGQAFKAMAWALNRMTGGDDYTAGAANYSPEQMRYLTQQALGGLYRLGTESYELMEKMLTDDRIMPQDVPLSNVFLRSRATEKQQSEKFYENRDVVTDMTRQFKDAHAADDQVKLNELLSEHPWLAGAQLNAGSKFGKMAQAGKPMAMLRNTNNSIRKLRADRQAAFLRVGRYDGISQAESRKRMREIDAEIADLQKSFTRHFNQWEGRGAGG